MPNVPVADTFTNFDPSKVPSPCFVVDEVAIERNLQILARVQNESGCRILLALKAFSMFSLAPLINRYLKGTTASGLWEARLGQEKFGGEVHVYSAAYKQADIAELVTFADHLIFNSPTQWQRFRQQCENSDGGISVGLRINPLHSEGALPLYDPCAPGSRLGTPVTQLSAEDFVGISGIHFHTLCEQGFQPLARTLDALEASCSEFLPQMSWVNFGGGHHITHPEYDVESLIKRIKAFREKWQVDVYLEPGEAIAIRSGVLVTEVLDLMENSVPIAVLDTSATCHMPDTLEMPYRAFIHGSAPAGELPFTYKLGGMSCLAGDVMGDYSFPNSLEIGQRLIFDDMAHYTMVKTTTFNGVRLPALAIYNSLNGEIRLIKEFRYNDFRDRLS
jgi:carboxynorspermidine decarboxylase